MKTVTKTIFILALVALSLQTTVLCKKALHTYHERYASEAKGKALDFIMTQVMY